MRDNKQLNVSNCLIGLQHPLFAQHCTAQYLQTLPKTWRHSLSSIEPGYSNKPSWFLIFPLVHSAHFSNCWSLIWHWCILQAQKVPLEMEACSLNWICLTDVTRDNEYAVDRCLCYVHILGSRTQIACDGKQRELLIGVELRVVVDLFHLREWHRWSIGWIWGTFKTTSWMNRDSLTLAAAGKGLSFPFRLHSRPIFFAEIPVLTARLQASGQQAAEPGQGLPAAKRKSTFFGTSFPAPAHRFLLPPQLQLWYSSGPSRDKSISSKWYSFAMLWHREHASLVAKSVDHFIVYSVPVSTGGVFCNLDWRQQNSKERLTGSMITGDGSNGILTGKCQTQHSSPICCCAKSNTVENWLRQGLQMKVVF